MSEEPRAIVLASVILAIAILVSVFFTNKVSFLSDPNINLSIDSLNLKYSQAIDLNSSIAEGFYKYDALALGAPSSEAGLLNVVLLPDGTILQTASDSVGDEYSRFLPELGSFSEWVKR